MAGASLVELMIVVGIIGAIAAMAVANMPRMSRDMRIGRAAHTYAGLLREARGRAMANRAFVAVSFESPGIVLKEQNRAFGVTSFALADPWQTIRVYNVQSSDFQNVTIVNHLTSGSMVVYNPRGLLANPTNMSGSVQFTSAVPGPTIKQTVRITSNGWVEKR